MNPEKRRIQLLRRLERVASVQRFRSLEALAEAQSEVERSAALARRSKVLAANDPNRRNAREGRALGELMRFSGVMTGIAREAEASHADAGETIVRARDALQRIDRKIERTAERQAQLRKRVAHSSCALEECGNARGLARKLLGTRIEPSDTSKGETR